MAIGSNGLNLQCANTVILLDYEWNSGTTNQAIARVARRGQIQPVTVYRTVSNTGIEKGILQKHLDKAVVVDELAIGPSNLDIETMHLKEIVTLLKQDIVTESMHTLAVANKEILTV